MNKKQQEKMAHSIVEKQVVSIHKRYGGISYVLRCKCGNEFKKPLSAIVRRIKTGTTEFSCSKDCIRRKPVKKVEPKVIYKTELQKYYESLNIDHYDNLPSTYNFKARDIDYYDNKGLKQL